ncbi:MAG TPA: DEAD/DEAH box helicase [Candidatus Nanoarchaeia archaeon]|nr:DEAD/DEAH box helicase [Candidatus Nanoarchaeia archaeon]
MGDDRDLRDFFGKTILDRGSAYFRNGRVLKLIQKEKDIWVAQVQGSERLPYEVELDVSDEDYIDCECSCPYGLECKHAAAAMLAIRARLENHTRKGVRKAAREGGWRERLSVFQTPAPSGAMRVAITLDQERQPIVRLHAVRDAQGNLRPSGGPVTVHYFQYFGNVPKSRDLSSPERMILDVVSEHGKPLGKGEYALSDEGLASFLPLLSTHSDLLTEDSIGISRDPIEWSAVVTKGEKGYVIQNAFRDKDGSIPSAKILGDLPWVLVENLCRPLGGWLSSEFLQMLSRQELIIPHKDWGFFLEGHFGYLQGRMPIALAPEVMSEFIDLQPSPHVLIREENGNLIAETWFAYGVGPPQVDASTKTQYVSSVHEGLVRWCKRAHEAEEKYLRLAEMTLQVPSAWRTILSGREAILLVKRLALLPEKGFSVTIKENVKRYALQRGSVRTVVSSGKDWFDLERLTVNDQSVPLAQFMSRYQGDGLLELPDGSWVEVDQERCNKLRESLKVAMHVGERHKQAYRLRRYHAPLMEDLVDDDLLKERIRKSIDYQSLKKMPQVRSLKSKLRSYQKSGLQWLWFLRQNSFGGILADDMGLGKTLQALALLQMNKEQGVKRPSLVVAPASVTQNWYNEVQKHTALRPLLFTGKDRQASWKDADLVITSYPLLVRDKDILEKTKWDYAVFDESQKIKNRLTETYAAARQMRSDHQICLTGTPIENHLGELWAQFSIVAPGLLGTITSFQDLYMSKDRHPDAMALLKKRIRPFLLRRKKGDVERDLPQKTEKTLVLEMSPLQRQIYDRLFEYYRQKVLSALKSHTMAQARFIVLTALTKLRLACLHTNLAKLPGVKEQDSVKLERLLEIINEVSLEGHRLLVFSQFTSFLQIVKKHLRLAKIPYCYLDGKTPQHERQREVDEFNASSHVPVFLLSLKAGGTGLNITSADYVIHLDPWWNPAVEDQATDRAHRIGQTKPVVVYKLLVKDTVEEKILSLQQEKRSLAGDILEGSGQAISRKDIESLFCLTENS